MGRCGHQPLSYRHWTGQHESSRILPRSHCLRATRSITRIGVASRKRPCCDPTHRGTPRFGLMEPRFSYARICSVDDQTQQPLLQWTPHLNQRRVASCAAPTDARFLTQTCARRRSPQDRTAASELDHPSVLQAGRANGVLPISFAPIHAPGRHGCPPLVPTSRHL
jgi:hypothetical protein